MHILKSRAVWIYRADALFVIAAISGMLCLGSDAKAGTLAKLTIKPEKGDEISASTLSWESTPGFIYKIQRSSDLSHWTAVDSKVAVSNCTAVELVGGPQTEFYRLAAATEIFTVEPSWINSADPNAVLYVVGQCLPDNATVLINGFSLTPTILNSGGVWASVSLNGLPPGQPLTGDLSVMDNTTSNVVAKYKLQSGFIYATAPSPSALMCPPDMPPASPTPVFGKKLYVGNLPFSSDSSARWQQQGIGHTLNVKGAAFATGGDDDCDGGPDESFMKMKAKEKANRTKCSSNLRVIPGTGELQVDETDVAIPGRGMHFVWTRSYRSRTGRDTAQGQGWDFSYNVSLSQQPDGTVQICMGNGRCDTFYSSGTNVWTRDEYFVEVRDLNNDGMPDVLFADTGKWLFNPSNGGSPASGKLSSIVDRNGNTISLNYDLSGRLSAVVDTLGRTNVISYNGAGRIDSLTDFSGRIFRYEYDTNGDLTACVSPAVLNTVTTNEFPGGKTNRYAYLKGALDDRLNHNLISCIDATGQRDILVSYQSTTNSGSIDFDAVSLLQVGADLKFIRRVAVQPSPTNQFAVTQVFVNDYLGNVTEYFCDSRQRCVRELQFTGRAAPGVPTTATENRPTNKLRLEDPDFFETRWAWNSDSLCTKEILPSGLTTCYVYERDCDSSANARLKGNLRVMREIACCIDADSDGDGLGDFNERCWYFEHDPRFGSDPLALDGIVPSVSSHAINTKGAGSNAGKMVPTTANHAINTKGAGAGAGKYMVMGTKHAINTKGTGTSGRMMPTTSNVAIKTKGTGADKNRVIVNDIKRRNTSDRRNKPDITGPDCGDTSFCTMVIDPRGNVCTATYDAKGNCSSINPRAARDNHLQGAADVLQALRFGYNTNGQLISVTNAADGNGFRRIDLLSYYSSGPQLGYLQTCVIDASGQAITENFEYDLSGNVVRYVDPRTNDWLFTYNSLDQCVRAQTPVNVSERCVTDYLYDANDNLVQIITDIRDDVDTKTGSHVTRIGYDSQDRIAFTAEEVSTGQFVTNRFQYDANDNLTMIRSPLAVSGIEPNNIVTFQYDERGLLYRSISAPGTAAQNTEQFDYSLNGKLGRANDGIETPGSGNSYEYDSFDRCVRVTDAMGNVTRCAYDRNDNLVFLRIEAEPNDVPGSAGNLRYHEWTWKHDLQGRCSQASSALFDPLTQASYAAGKSTTTFSYAPNDALLSVTDSYGHATTCTYDTACRLASVTDPKTNTVSYAYDAAGNLVTVTQDDRSDLTGTVQRFVVVRAFNKMHRLTRCSDNVGNEDQYSYDSLGNLVRHIDPKGTATISEYDGLGRKLKVYVDSNADGTIGAGDSKKIFVWDQNGRLSSLTDGNTNTTSYAYDSRNRCISITEPDNTSCSLVWSPRSNLILRQDANGTAISNSFDALDRCVRRDVSPGPNVAATTTFELFAYDGLSRMVLASNNVSQVQLGYDSMGNCVRHIQDGWQMLSAFDANGNRLSVTYPSGGVVSYTYDSANQLSSVTGPPLVDGAPPVLLAAYGYEGPGRVGRIIRGNGANTRITWSGAANATAAPGDYGWQQVSLINHQIANGGPTIDRRSFTYDRNQNKTLRSQLVPFVSGGDLTTNVFDYDPLNRVKMAIKTKGTGAQRMDYSLDPRGNRQSVALDFVPHVYIMESNVPPADFQVNQYTATPFSTQTFDENGNLNSRSSASGQLQYQYDYADRLVSVLDLTTGTPQEVASFTYDALGRRIGKNTRPLLSLATVTARYLYDSPSAGDCDDGDSRVIEERVDGTVFQIFCWGSNLRSIGDLDRDGRPDLVAAIGNGQLRYFHSDELGNVLAATDGAGGVLERYDYDDFGAPQFMNADGGTLTGSDGLPVSFSTVGNPFLFHGMFWDEETSLYFEKGWPCRYEGPRYYDYVSGRYILRAGVPLRFETESTFSGDNPWSLKKEEGGRHTPFHNKYRPQLRTAPGGGRIQPQPGYWRSTESSAARVPRNVLKSYFETGDVPTAEQFRKLLDRGEAGDGFNAVTVNGVTLTPRLRIGSVAY